MKFPTYEQMAKDVAEKALDEILYDGKSIREWIKIIIEQESKTGHWIEKFNDIEGEVRFTCSCCGKYQLFGTDYCYHCGARMSEANE